MMSDFVFLPRWVFSSRPKNLVTAAEKPPHPASASHQTKPLAGRKVHSSIHLVPAAIAWLTLLCWGLEATAQNPPWDLSGLPADFEYFRNPWQVIGLKDHRDGTRVSPDGRLILPDGRQVVVRLGPAHRALPRSTFPTLLDGWLPIICFRTEESGIEYQILYWATPLPELSQNDGPFNWPEHGDSYSNWIQIHAHNRTGATQSAAVAVAVVESSKIHLQEQTTPLPAGGSQSWAWRIDFRPGNESSVSHASGKSARTDRQSTGLTGSAFQQNQAAPDAAAIAVDPPAALRWLERTRRFWIETLRRGAEVELPCPKALHALWAAHVCQLISSDHGEVHAGEGFYDELYIRDGAYQILHLLEAGFLDSARKAIERFLLHQRPDGRFETQQGQLDANGQAMWAFWKFYRMTGDREFLRVVYPHMERAARWIQQARRQEPADSPFAGLLPPAVADGEYLWDGKHRIVGYDFWNLRGMICVSAAAAELGLPQEAQRWQEEAADYRRAIDRAWEKLGIPYFPPSWEKAGTHWGNTETLWPTELFDPDDPRVVALIEHVRQQWGGGYYEGTIRWIGHRAAIHPYMGAYTALASLRRGQVEEVLSDFFWYLLHSSASHAFPEGIYPESRTAWSNTIPHALGAANYAILLRHLLIDERTDGLHLLPAVPPQWLTSGQGIRIERAPTEFGMISLSLKAEDIALSGRIECHWRSSPPPKLILHVPCGLKLGELSGLEDLPVEIRPGTAIHGDWSYERVLREYLQQAPPRTLAEIPHLLPQPVVPPPRPEQCQPLDLRALANTDPFSAPFGVPRPGKYLFTGMPTGRVMLAGVPFEIIRPEQNGGRGLVVLHSGEYPAAAQFPREVEIPVKEKVRRIYFLGNVAGWAVRDEGTGPWNAVAEYRLVYEDSSEQIVPLVPGRTLDDWAAPPSAEDVWPVLRGQPWHLNLLTVSAADKPLQKIVFRDLGTSSAPALVAITIER
jgi:hypothetical protein